MQSNHEMVELEETLKLTESQNGWVGRDLKDHEAPTPPPQAGPQPPHLIPAQAAQGPIQPGLEHLQGWTGHPQPLWATCHGLGDPSSSAWP